MSRTREVWGPATPLLLFWERDFLARRDKMRRTMAALMCGPAPHYPYQIPQHVLRLRATYGGKKGRAAIKRLKAMGAHPLCSTPEPREQ